MLWTTPVEAASSHLKFAPGCSLCESMLQKRNRALGTQRIQYWQSGNQKIWQLSLSNGIIYSRTMPKDRAEEVSRGSFVFVLQSGD